SPTWRTTRRRPSIFACGLTCCHIAERSHSHFPPGCAPRFRVSPKSGSLRKFLRDSSSTILGRCPPSACSSRTRNLLFTPRVLPNCLTRSMSLDACGKLLFAPPVKAPDAAPISITSTLITGICCSGTRRSRNWRARIERVRPMQSFAPTASRASTRTPCSAMELGRSFVRPEYQRQYAPLLLLWKGIARFVAAHPETPVLFGAVSISNDYSSLSREMIVRYFEQRRVKDEDGREFADLIQARTPFRAPKLRRWDCGALCSLLRDLEELAEPISDLEEDGKGLPILLKQY